ncbi:MAG: hypothetical protein RIR33_2492 [Pseudomonadota bacterium]|jgi:hypothetical protein
MTHNWNRARAEKRIEAALSAVEDVEIVDYTRDTSLADIPVHKAYRMRAAHLYADIVNLDDILGVTEAEGETCHRRTLRFLNLHYRAVDRILKRTDARRVDFHNQRLHAVIAKPYGATSDEIGSRIHRAIAIAQLIIDVVAETGDDDENIPDAQIRVGIDSGLALAVNNGRRGGREPLFLGSPANKAAKFAGASRKTGIYLTNNARKFIGLPAVDQPKSTALTAEEIATSQEAADLGVDKDTIVAEWREDLENNPIGSFTFKRHTPPLKTMDIGALTPANSRRQESASLYADLDGFSAYIAARMQDNDKAKDAVRVLHVLRSEMDNALSIDFEGRRIRFIGDCLHGVMCEGTAQTTDEAATVSDATLCAGAIRSSFDLAIEKLTAKGIDVKGLGIQIGFDLGPISITRLGMQGDRVRCAIARSVRNSEREQLRCAAGDTAIGQAAYDAATDAVKEIFETSRITSGLDYNEAVEALASAGDETAKASKKAALAGAAPAIIRASDTPIRPHADGC